MAAIDRFRELFKKTTIKRGDQWMEEIPVFVGKKDGTVSTGIAGMIWVRDYFGQEIPVFNNVVPSTPNLLVTIGRRKDQPSLWQVIGQRDAWSTPGTGALSNHHAQHELGGLDEVTIDRKQIPYYTIRATQPASYSIIIYGGYFPSANGFGYTPTQIVDMTDYISAEGAYYVAIETDDDGVLSYHAGTNFYTPELGGAAYIPVPDPGKYHIGYFLTFDGQTAIDDNQIRVPTPLGVIAKASGLQIHEATSGTPVSPDEFSFWSVLSSTLKKITFEGLKALLATTLVTSNISNPPTEAEIILLLGNAIARGAGYMALIQDTGAAAPLYLVVSDGSRWWYHCLTKGMYVSSDPLTISEIDHRNMPSPDIYPAGISIGQLTSSSLGLELVVPSGASQAGSPPYHGHLTIFGADGSTLLTFTTPSTTSYGMVSTIGDIDNDGVNEIGATFYEGKVYLLDPDGTVRWSYALTGGNYARAVAIGKVHPSHAENQMVVGGYNGQFALLDKDGTQIWLNGLGSGATVQMAVVADTDGDGQNEIIIAFNKYVRKYNYAGTQVWTKTLGDVTNDTLAVAVGNVTGATGLEIAAAVSPRYGSGTVNSCYLLDKDGNEIWHWTPPLGGCQGLMIADVNGDGQNEVIVGYGNTEAIAGGGDPTSGASGGIAILNSSGSVIGQITSLTQTVEFLAWGDVNNDGENEIIASCDDGKVHIFRVIASHAQDISNIGRLTAYEDTKANAVALTGSLSEVMFARATDTGELGIYIAGSWHWYGATPTLTMKEQDNSPSVSDVSTVKVSNGLLVDNGSGTVSLYHFEPLTNGNPASPALVFDGNGDVIMVAKL